jgi:hypothetical protein
MGDGVDARISGCVVNRSDKGVRGEEKRWEVIDAHPPLSVRVPAC